MADFQTLFVTVENGIGTITINRPEVRNALSRQVVSELQKALEMCRHDSKVKVVVFTGAGDKSFVAGADIRELREWTLFEGLAAAMQELCNEIEQYEKPTIAAINGTALGGGCELAMACDIRIAQENARLGLPEVGLSVLPGAGGTQRLARVVGKGKAIELILTGAIIEAREAERISLVSKVVKSGELMQAVREMAEVIMSKGPLAVRLAKLAIQTGFETDQRTGLIVERLAQALLYTTEDKREGTTAFLEKRKPHFQGK